MSSVEGPPEEETHEVRFLARGGAFGILGMALSQASLFLIVLIIAAQDGTAGVGVYSQAFAIFTLVSLVSLFGAQTTLTRYIADGLVGGENHNAIRRLIKHGTRIPFALGIGFTLVLLLTASMIGNDVLTDADTITPLRLMALAVPLATYARSAAAALQGFGRVRDMTFTTSILEPGVRLLTTCVLVLLGYGVTGAGLALVVSNGVAALWAWRRLHAVSEAALEESSTERRFDRRDLLRFSALTSAASLATTGLLWADTIILGIFTSSEAVGVYQVATRILALATMATTPIATAFAPRIADLIRRDAHERLELAYSVTTLWSARLAVPALALCVAAPAELASIVDGGAGQAAVNVTIVLAVGKLVEAATGPCGMVLNMSNRVGLNALNNVLALTLNIGLNVALIPVLGLTGAALAWSIALAALNIARALEVRHLLQLTADTSRVLTTVALGVGPGLVAWWIVSQLHGLTGLVLGGTVVLLGFAGGVALLDWQHTDAEVVGALMSRRTPNARGNGGKDMRVSKSTMIRRHLARRLRSRFGRRHSATTTFAMAELISPLRYDVLVRADFFRFLRTHRRLWDTDRSALLRLSRAQPYFVWFQQVAMEDNPFRRRVEALFAERVQRSVALLDEWEASGFDPRTPVQLWEVEQALPTATGKLVARSHYIGDGCHRLALLWLDGVTRLQPHHVQIQRRWQFSPRDNTGRLLRSLAVSDREYYDFLSLGYDVEPPARTGAELWHQVGEDQRDELRRVLDVDDRLRSAGHRPQLVEAGDTATLVVPESPREQAV